MKKLLTLLVSLLALVGKSQSPSEAFLGSWYTYGSNHRLSEKYSVNPYGELRFYEPSSNYNLAFFSIRGNYHLKDNQSIGLGYAYLDIDTVFEFDNEPNVHENRLFEQYTLSRKFEKFVLIHRARLEQRFLDFKDRNETQNRFRYRLSLKYTLNKTLFLIATEEPFVNFQDQVFHENRFYLGIGFQIMEHSQLQIGYLKQHIRKNSLNRIQVGISIKTDHRKTTTNVSRL
ncbi:MAG: DUF2490 domain-containing protein [Winogradskyella sp.]|uniref:DUF2490 domain-containing protein n=1 Tax=Winogradskyella sp. TaxID=1883156 RepID=UPI0017D51488|nr:DUF2490 domain-containing protein [Winogradskyella sp.]MBT8243869.1 DUF2490 domain-containing protein [Winogradskyella sp.]NNK22274.1 DUF2490 domain-containing protein [Winogradskyella sp.]